LELQSARVMLTDADVRYIRTNFRPLEALCEDRVESPADVRTLIAAGRLPQPTYVLDDGTEMFPPDYFGLVDDAGGVDALRAEFERRFAAAAERYGGLEHEAELAEEWAFYLSGEYGACVRRLTPEEMVRKDRLVKRVDGLLADPRPDDEDWARELRERVDELDSVEREFAPFDRIRFGGPVSRDRLITAARERYPEIFVGRATAEAIR
jgi:hypothetical protein